MRIAAKLILPLGAAVLAVSGVMAWRKFRPSGPPAQLSARPQGPVTFTKHIAPIVFTHCAGCHRPGQSAPFALLTYADVQRRAKQIAEVTRRRIMPPWLPEAGYGEFVGERVLKAGEVELFQEWLAQGAAEGTASDLPPIPQWSEGWSLGEPDLVVQMPLAFTLPAEGKDIYRNFIAPIPVSGLRYVQAIEFHPGNAKVVHHAFFRFDQTSASRRLDDQDADPGFGGVHPPSSAQSPEGYFLGWQPGKVASKLAEGFAWRLEKNSDLVFQMHLQPSGKPELLQSSVGFYFTDKPPSNTPYKIRLTSFDIDIPAGAKEHVVKDRYVLPVDAEVIGILPHAHYLGKKLHGIATLPNGAKKWLLRIDRWNFDWQGDYRYAKPVFLPKGTALSMEFTYDNSAENARNPNQPPKRVQYGLQSSDEMAELWLQVLVRSNADREILSDDDQRKVTRETVTYNTFLLRSNPNDARALTELGKAMMFERRFDEALRYLRAAAQNAADSDEPHYFLGLLLRSQKKLAEAKAAFENAVRINPQNFKAHGNLGLIYLEQGSLNEAEPHFREALRINPDDVVARESLDELLRAKRAAERRRK